MKRHAPATLTPQAARLADEADGVRAVLEAVIEAQEATQKPLPYGVAVHALQCVTRIRDGLHELESSLNGAGEERTSAASRGRTRSRR